jgi:hypothetical protein
MSDARLEEIKELLKRDGLSAKRTRRQVSREMLREIIRARAEADAMRAALRDITAEEGRDEPG